MLISTVFAFGFAARAFSRRSVFTSAFEFAIVFAFAFVFTLCLCLLCVHVRICERTVKVYILRLCLHVYVPRVPLLGTFAPFKYGHYPTVVYNFPPCYAYN